MKAFIHDKIGEKREKWQHTASSIVSGGCEQVREEHAGEIIWPESTLTTDRCGRKHHAFRQMTQAGARGVDY